jgi:hypothetical protein
MTATVGVLPVTARLDTGGPLEGGMDAVEEFLDEWQTPEIESDLPVSGEVVSPPQDWQFGLSTCRYVEVMIESWAKESDKPKGGRHPWAMNRAVRLACAQRLGCLTEDGLKAAKEHLGQSLAHWCAVTTPVRTLHPDEVGSAYRWALDKVATFDDQRTRKELGNHIHPVSWQQGGGEDPYAWFWELTPTLRHIRDSAYARLVGPWAVLGVEMARVVAKVPPTVQLPPWVCGHASLNLFIALVGLSGEGKGGPEKTARDAFRLGPVYTTGIGSGQGINHLFAHYDGKLKTTVMDRWSVYFSVPEIDTIGSERGRTGSNLLPQMRKAWDGAELTFGYADRTKSIVVGEHTYRLVAVVGVQPGRAKTLLEDVDAGTPQRYLWLPALAPGTPMEDVQAPEPIDLSAITEGWPQPQTNLAEQLLAAQEGRPDRHVFVLPEAARELIRTNRKRKVRGEATDPALDGHLGLCRMKAATALALLHGERDDTKGQFWDMSQVLMAKSQATRASVEAHLAEQKLADAKAQGWAQGVREVVAEEVHDDAAIKRVAQGIVRFLNKHGGNGTYGEVRREGCAGRDRKKYFDAALDRLVEAGSIIVVDDEIKLAVAC